MGDIKLRLLQDTDAYCTTFLDFYGLSEHFPSKVEVLQSNELIRKRQTMHQVFADKLEEHLGSTVMQRFIPHIQFYECEGLLFSEPEILVTEAGHADLQANLQAIRNQFDTRIAVAVVNGKVAVF